MVYHIHIHIIRKGRKRYLKVISIIIYHIPYTIYGIPYTYTHNSKGEKKILEGYINHNIPYTIYGIPYTHNSKPLSEKKYEKRRPFRRPSMDLEDLKDLKKSLIIRV